MWDERQTVAIIGSGTWATTFARNIGVNAANLQYMNPFVNMYVHEELFEGEKLTEIINTRHENVKYLPGYALPTNIIALPDVVETAHNADIIVFAIPASFVITVCKLLLGKIKPTALAISLIKGFERGEDGQIVLISELIQKHLKISCSCLVGANLAHELSSGRFCEGTIGCRDQKYAKLLQDLFRSDSFRVEVSEDADCVEICATLRNIIAFSTGCADAMNLNENTKASIIRHGFLEMVHFVDVFYPGSRLSTFLLACGLSDLILSCYANRNRKLAEAFVKSAKPLCDLEHILLPGHEPLGPVTADMVFSMLHTKGVEKEFPLFSIVHKICTGEAPLKSLIEQLKNASDEM